MKIKKEKLLLALGNFEEYRVPSLKRLAEVSGYSCNKSVLRVIESLQKEGLIDDNRKPIYKKLRLNTSGTSYDCRIKEDK